MTTKTSPFTEPQKKARRIRRNCGTWNPLVDLTDIYAGQRSNDRQGVYDLFDAPVEWCCGSNLPTDRSR